MTFYFCHHEQFNSPVMLFKVFSVRDEEMDTAGENLNPPVLFCFLTQNTLQNVLQPKIVHTTFIIVHFPVIL